MINQLIQRAKNRFRLRNWKKKSNEEIFTEIYEKRLWKNDESVSGGGSTIEGSRHLAFLLPHLIHTFHIKSITDVACGDFNWMRHVDLNGIKYLGYDIVEDLIEQNQKKYASTSVQFQTGDALKISIPSTDLIICRDVMVHLKNEDGQSLIKNIVRSNAKYLLATTFPKMENDDIQTGSWRPINLQASPFLLATPEVLLNEMPLNLYPNTPQKFIGLWNIEKLKK